MNDKQTLTPKYWIGHRISTDDVDISTAAKSYLAATLKMNRAYPDWQDDLDFDVSLFELWPTEWSRRDLK